jgi:hypothetical protein
MRPRQRCRSARVYGRAQLCTLGMGRSRGVCGGSPAGRAPPWVLELLVAGMPEARRSSGEEWWSYVTPTLVPWWSAIG